MLAKRLVNFVAFQCVWFACVLPAANGLPYVGPLVVGVWLCVHLAMWRDRAKAELAIAGAAAVIGYLFDSLLVLNGIVWFPDQARLGGPTTLWMVAMWVSFATTLCASLGWMRGRYVVAAAFGLVGGPLAYLTGARLGAIELVSNPWLWISFIGGEWLIATPLLLWVVPLCERLVSHADTQTTDPRRPAISVEQSA